MDPPPQDELRQTIKAIDALGRLEARYEEDNAYNGRYNNYRQDPHPRQDHKDNEDNSAKHIKAETPTLDGVRNPQIYSDWVREMEHFFEWYE